MRVRGGRDKSKRVLADQERVLRWCHRQTIESRLYVNHRSGSRNSWRGGRIWRASIGKPGDDPKNHAPRDTWCSRMISLCPLPAKWFGFSEGAVTGGVWNTWKQFRIRTCLTVMFRDHYFTLEIWIWELNSTRNWDIHHDWRIYKPWSTRTAQFKTLAANVRYKQ